MKDKNLTTNEENRNKFAYFWISFYIIMLSLVNILLIFLISHLSIPLIIMSLAIVTVLAVWTWRQSFQDNILYIHNISNMLGGVLLGILAACCVTLQLKLEKRHHKLRWFKTHERSLSYDAKEIFS